MPHDLVSPDKNWSKPGVSLDRTVLFSSAHLLYAHTHGRGTVPQIFSPPPALLIRNGAFYTVYPHQISQEPPKCRHTGLVRRLCGA